MPIHRIASTAVSLVLVLALSAAPARARPHDEKPPGPVLIAQGDDFLVHAVPYPSEREGGSGPGATPAGHLLLHTTTSTGSMKTLATTGTTAIPTRRIRYHHSRLCGLAADAANDRLWVLSWSVTTWDRPPTFEGGRLSREHAPGTEPAGFYKLELHRLSDGQPVPPGNRGPRDLKNMPAGVPAPAVDKGGLEVIEGGVSVFGQPVKFTEPPKPGAAPPAPEPANGEVQRLRTLLEQLNEPDEYARGFAITQLEQLDDPAAIESLIGVIDDRRGLPGGDNWVGAAAVRALATLTNNKGPVQSFEKADWEAWWQEHRAEYLNNRPDDK